MKLFASLYFDEDVDILIAKLLVARGHDVLTAREADMLETPDDVHSVSIYSQPFAF